MPPRSWISVISIDTNCTQEVCQGKRLRRQSTQAASSTPGGLPRPAIRLRCISVPGTAAQRCQRFVCLRRRWQMMRAPHQQRHRSVLPFLHQVPCTKAPQCAALRLAPAVVAHTAAGAPSHGGAPMTGRLSAPQPRTTLGAWRRCRKAYNRGRERVSELSGPGTAGGITRGRRGSMRSCSFKCI